MQHSPTSNGLQGDPLWYKDAIIYEAHVRAFYDSNADGMGDFRGLAEKLDYLEDLGVTAIWLLPFFPSPWKDDGYDISDFREVHPAYGNLRDFQYFLREAHRRNLRVITELVVNHTSDKHEWFQKSRRAEPGSSWRDFYVWSDTPDRYNGTRIIFKDFEPSNWSWDPVAKAYYWHRFYSHQPDLNFDSPLVRRTIIRTLDYWAQMGVDGFRLDAIPYLYEREGTSCENLPETHAFLKELRKHMDATYPGRMFLAEANMWPEDAVAYFGKGDECHVSFHFPLMPRLFMALRLEDRLPIVEILKRTPEIPETCQWAMFLRNHDELTLEMVTDEERDYMYRVYASDQRARINLGIRRRLAPLLGNDRQRIEVMNALLFSMPGTPVLYYGDEIGMGDNVYLGDRNGVRTPMQWSPDRNAGFSAANPQQLYLPVNIDPAYHYEAINVETQQSNPNSLLNWTKRLIALRKQYKAFGRGTIEFLQPSNQRVLAFIRRYGDEAILVIANLSRFAQAVELDLPKFKGYTPVEMFGRTDFPVIGESYYPVTLGPNSFFWFALEQRAAPVTVSTTSRAARRAEVPVLALPALADIWSAEIHASLASVLPAFLANTHWFRGENRRIRSLRVLDSISVIAGRSAMMLVRIEYTSGDPEDYFVPVAMARGDEAQAIREEKPESALAEVRAVDGSKALLYDGATNNEFSTALLEAFARRKRLRGERGSLAAQRNRRFRQIWGGTHPSLDPTLLTSEINTSIKFGDHFILKLLRRIEPGPHSGVEMGQYLAGDGPQALSFIVPFAGDMVYQADSGESITLAVLHGFVKSEGTAWNTTMNHLASFIDGIRRGQHSRADIEGLAPANFYTLSFALSERTPLATELIGTYLDLVKIMGRRTAEMHLALSRDSADPAFSPEPFNDFYRQSLYHGYIGLTNRRLEFVRQRYSEMTGEVQALASKVLDLEPAILAKFKAIFEERIASMRTRFHGRLHLGHMLMTGDDVTIFDFEGDPAQHLSERRIKRCPLRDVASMLVSFGYASQMAIRQFLLTDKSEALTRSDLRMWLRFWYAHVCAAFMEAYWNVAGHASYMPSSQADQETLLSTYMLERAMLDIRPDISDKPEFAGMPFRLIIHILNAEEQLDIRK
ncbi:MAG: maltose alpha-D-glucosyltransferase [Bryobacteraceae bacterium]